VLVARAISRALESVTLHSTKPAVLPRDAMRAHGRVCDIAKNPAMDSAHRVVVPGVRIRFHCRLASTARGEAKTNEFRNRDWGTRREARVGRYLHMGLKSGSSVAGSHLRSLSDELSTSPVRLGCESAERRGSYPERIEVGANLSPMVIFVFDHVP